MSPESVADDAFTDHIAEKRRRLSLHQSHTLRQYIPRSSVDYGANGTAYEAVVHRIAEEDDSKNNMERRNTVVDDLHAPVALDKYAAPIPDFDIVRRQSSAMVQRLQSESESDNAAEQVVDIAPLYTDDEGNLVRPPFINLDPRERYQLVQLKREMELARALQRQLKYSVDPNETASVLLPSNQVETATQTYDVHYLRNKLNFSSLLKRDPPKTKMNSSGYFSGDFAYDVDETPDSAKNSLRGYLGSVSKPAFTKSDKRGHTTEKVHLSLDKDYVSRAESVSDIIKVKDSKTDARAHTEPSSGFKFNIDKTEINELINKRKQDNELAHRSKRRASEDTAPSQVSAATSKLDEKPAFSFGATSKPTSETEKPESAAPSKPFSFGATAAAGNKTEPAPGASGPKTEASKPLFGFNPPKPDTSKAEEDNANGKSAQAGLFTFGGSGEPTKPKPAFTFGAAEKPQFSFEEKKQSQGANPPFRFGKAETPNIKEAPAFSLGADKEPKKALSFEQKKVGSLIPSSEPGVQKQEQQGFSFGQSAKPTFSFTPEASGSSEEPASKFGQAFQKSGTPTSFGTGSSDTKPFTFASDKKEEKPTPTFSFGSKGGDAPAAAAAFAFGASKEGTPSSAGSAAGSAEKANFSFGKPNVDKPSFNFGAVEKPSFNFGGVSKPDFNFGAAAVPAFGGSGSNNFQFAPSFNKDATPFASTAAPFANGATPIKPGDTGAFAKEATPGQFSVSRSNTGTPEFAAAPAPGFGGKPRKIAQMRRRRGM